MQAMATGTDLDALLRAAHEVAYRFPPGFDGFTAVAEVVGQRTFARGEVVVAGPGQVALRLDDAPDDDRAWAEREVASWVAPPRSASSRGRRARSSPLGGC